MRQSCLLLFLTILIGTAVSSDTAATSATQNNAADWLIDPAPYVASIERSKDERSLILSNGLIRRVIRIDPAGATVALDNLVTGNPVLRSVRPEAKLTIDGVDYEVGGLEGQSNHAFLRPKDLDHLTENPDAMRLVGWEESTPEAAFGWKRVRNCDYKAKWPPAGVALRMDYAFPQNAGDTPAPKLRVSVHYELYDSIPCYSKWITVSNDGQETVVIDRFTSEILAVVESESRVEWREGVDYPNPNLWVETDFAAGGAGENGQRWSVHWQEDPAYTSQVNYMLKTPCLLECKPGVGPAQDLLPGGVFTSFKSHVLVHDSDDRNRNGLARCKMYRTIAPWVTENPLMMHVRHANEDSVKLAIDQCAAVGFEMVILTFGSGFNIESTEPSYIAKLKSWAEYANARGIEIGGYSLLSSRRIGNGNDIVSPPGQKPAHGNCPALTSEWGQNYYKKLYDFFPATGFSLLEHDGPYPGDFDVTARPPLQKGLEDSQWAQFWIAANFYRWCRSEGIYLNTPDWYHLNGSTKSAMGYREVNWSLPRADQVLHTRQNIFDGTRVKTPTMGWMFVPLTVYHGGGADATVEPLHQHLDHYASMMDGNLGGGVQACYRGPRLYDTDATRAMVAQKVAWFREHRKVLESDIDHAASRRADGRDLDWLLHVDPSGVERGMLLVHNPLDEAVHKKIDINLYYTGIGKRADVSAGDGSTQTLMLDRRYRVQLEVSVPAGGMSWYSIQGE